MRHVKELEAAGGGHRRRSTTRGRVDGGRAGLLALQRSAGNGAVAALLGGPAVQRACGCGTCGGCADKEEERQPVQREEEPSEPTSSLVPSVPTPRVETCAGSVGTGAAAGMGGETKPEGMPDTGVVNPSEDVTGGPGVAENPEDPLAEPAAGTAACKTLSWSDFPESDKSGAFTSYTFKQTGTTFTAEFDSASSYRSKIVEKVFDGHLTDCNSTDFKKFAFEIDGKPEGTCLATKQPGPATATKKEECASKIKPLVEAANIAESARLLRHEQYHMKMGCALAAKATAALAAGKKVTTADLTTKNKTQSTSYDSKAQTDHSCNQASQTQWEADIDAGLPKVTF